MPQPIDVVEALFFASDSPLPADRIREALDLADVGEARTLVEALRERYAVADGALTVVEVGGGFRMVTRPEIAPWLLRLAKTRTKARLSRPALETLAIVAYRQPVSRPEVDALRGVSSDAVLDNLLERRLIRIVGRKEAPGRPFLYETTREFLIAFGLRDVGDLPKVDAELIMPATGAEPAAETAADGTLDRASAAASDTPSGAPHASDGEPDPPARGTHGGAPIVPEDAREAPALVVSATDGQAQAEQDPRPGGTDVAPGR